MVNQSWRILDLLSRGDSLFTSTAHPQFNHHLGNEFYVISKQLPVYLGIKSHQFSALFFLTPYGSITNSTCTPPKLNMEPEHHPLQKKPIIFGFKHLHFRGGFGIHHPPCHPRILILQCDRISNYSRRSCGGCGAVLHFHELPKFLHPKKTSKGRNGLPFF